MSLEMKREVIKVFKPSEQEYQKLGAPIAEDIDAAQAEAGFNVIDRRKENGAKSVMIENTECLFYDDISWTIRVDYYEVMS